MSTQIEDKIYATYLVQGTVAKSVTMMEWSQYAQETQNRKERWKPSRHHSQKEISQHLWAEYHYKTNLNHH